MQLEETQAEKDELFKKLKSAGEMLQKLGNAIVKEPDGLIFSNRPGFSFSAEKLRALSFNFKTLPEYDWIADNVLLYQQLIKKEANLRRKLGK